MKLYSALYNCFHPLDGMEEFGECKIVHTPEQLVDHGVLIVHGGADISPSLYHKARSRSTYAGEEPSHRDKAEWALMKEAVVKGMPIFGICRGAQLLCALSGGFLIQDVTDHGGRSHNVVTHDGKIFATNSIHHQMMYPFDVEHQMIAHTERRLSDHYMDVDTNIEVPIEPEMVYFPQTKGIAIQWHPEMMRAEAVANQYVTTFLRDVIRTTAA